MRKYMIAAWIAVCATSVGLAQTTDDGLTLGRVVELYLDGNLEVEAARLEVERVRADRIAATLRPNPDFTVTAENFKMAGNPSFGDLYEVAVSYSETVELGGKRRLRTAAADRSVAVAEAQLADTLRRGVAQVKQLYFQAVLSRDRVGIATENRAAFEELVQYTQARFDAGAVSEADLLKVRLEAVQFDRVLREAELVRDQALIRLVERLGESDYQRREVAGALQFTPLAYDLESLTTMALEERPDVRAAALEVALAADRLALERGKGSPNISPFVGYKRVASSDTILFGVSIPLPFRDRNQGGVAHAVAGESIATARLGVIRNRTLAEVASAYRAWETARDQVRVFQQELLDQAEESYAIATVAYREGATELLPLLEAQRTQARVRDEFLQTLYDYQTSILNLELAVGRDFE